MSVNIYVNKGVNMSVTISIRVDEDIKQNIEALGYKPSDYLKKILIQELKKERSKKALAWFKKHRIKTKGNTAEELIRKDRDSK
jgi:hypothetical protein